MKIRVRFFASLREALGPEESLELPDGASVADARLQLISRGGAYTLALAPGRAVRCSLNQQMAQDDAPLADGAELAFFPPVTGG
jgi:molybdopterin synthase sulfur carrier subunit